MDRKYPCKKKNLTKGGLHDLKSRRKAYTSSIKSKFLVGDSRIGWNPQTYVRRNSRIYTRRNPRTRRQEISESLTSSFKSGESLYTCPCAPFYRETKRLLHSENTLESREYS
jgi:hypothetical protein